MNTYGALPNASLLHLYGFSEVGNPHDVVGGGPRPHWDVSDSTFVQALLQSSTLREVYERTCLERSHDISHAQRWDRLNREDLMEEEFEVDSSGQPEQSLLAVVKVCYLLPYSPLLSLPFPAAPCGQRQVQQNEREGHDWGVDFGGPVITGEGPGAPVSCVLLPHTLSFYYSAAQVVCREPGQVADQS